MRETVTGAGCVCLFSGYARTVQCGIEHYRLPKYTTDPPKLENLSGISWRLYYGWADVKSGDIFTIIVGGEAYSD
jgi:hypothetical protein